MALLGFIFDLPPLARAQSLSSFLKLPRSFFYLLLFLLSFDALGLIPARAQSKEYQLKAAFLYNFAQFVKWPPGSFATPDAPFLIGVLGDDPFGGALDDTVQGESIDHHRLEIVHSQRAEDLKGCQIVFVSNSEDGHLGDILPQLGSKPILTVGDDGNFTRSGGIIDFYLSGGKVRFEINSASAQRSGLKISSQLLALGKIVSSDGGGDR